MTSHRKIILLIETSTSYGRGLIRGIMRYSRLVGPWIFYNEPRQFCENSPSLRDWGANGIVMRDSSGNLEFLKLGIPTIVSIRHKEYLEDHPNIVGDSKSMGKVAADHFLDRGFKNFAYCGFNEMPWSKERFVSFEKHVLKAGYSVHDYKGSLLQEKNTYQKQQDNLIDWLGSSPKPIGLMACNDNRGRHILEACKAAGVRVPDEAAVLGVNNDDMVCELSNPPLSSISVNLEKAGYEAAKLLDEMISGHKVKAEKILVEVSGVAIRQSTDILAIDDYEIAEAIRFIRKNRKKMIQVDEVADAVSVNRRKLERSFKKILGRSVHEEIKRCRIELISKFLVESDLPISRIATMMDFLVEHHISRYFQQETGMSPFEYRKKFSRLID